MLNNLKKELQMIADYLQYKIVIKDINDDIQINDWLIVSIQDRKVNSLFGKREVPHYVVEGMVVIPGRNYLSNGDPGYPDETDYEELACDRNIFVIARTILLKLFEQDMINFQGSIQEIIND